jgi:hypothetical protein
MVLVVVVVPEDLGQAQELRGEVRAQNLHWL